MLCFIPSQWYVFCFCNNVLTIFFTGTPYRKIYFSNLKRLFRSIWYRCDSLPWWHFRPRWRSQPKTLRQNWHGPHYLGLSSVFQQARQWIIYFFPKRRFVAGFFRRLLVYIISCISISIIPHILFQYASLQYVSFQYVSIQYASSSIQYISIQYVCISRNRIVLPLPPQRKVYFTETFSMSFLLSPAIRSSLSHRTYLSVDSPCIHVHKSRWWAQIFFIFTRIWGRFPIWLIFFRWVQTIYVFDLYTNRAASDFNYW